MSYHALFVALSGSLAVAAATLALEGSARAGSPSETSSTPSFEGAGKIVFSDLMGIRSSGMGYLGLSSFSYGGPTMTGVLSYGRGDNAGGFNGYGSSQSTWESFAVTPGVDMFVSKRATVGLVLGYGRTASQQMAFDAEGAEIARQTTVTSFISLAPRVGYVFPLGHGVSLWPRVGAGFTSAWGTSTIAGQDYTSRSEVGGLRLGAGVDVGVVYRPIGPLYFSAAPELAASWSVGGTAQSPSQVPGNTYEDVQVRFGGSIAMGLVLGG